MGPDLAKLEESLVSEVGKDIKMCPDLLSPKKENIQEEKTVKKETVDAVKSEPADKSKAHEKDVKSKASRKIKTETKDPKKRPPESKKSKVKSKAASKPALTPAIVDPSKDSDSDSDQLIVDEDPKKSRPQKTTSTMKPASLKLKLPSGSVKVKQGGGYFVICVNIFFFFQSQ